MNWIKNNADWKWLILLIFLLEEILEFLASIYSWYK